MPKTHPIHRAVTTIRAWLLMLIGIMIINAVVATPYLYGEVFRPYPFMAIALVAGFWAVRAWDTTAVVMCCSTIVVGTFLRGLEVLFYAEAFPLKQRLTGLTLWCFVSGTTLAFGILSLIAASRRLAEEWVRDANQSTVDSGG